METPLAPVQNIDSIAKELKARAAALASFTDEVGFRTAAEAILQSKAYKKAYVEHMEPIRKAQRAALDVTLNKLKEVKEMFDDVVEMLTPPVIAWKKKRDAEAAAMQETLNAGLDPDLAGLAPIYHSEEEDGLDARATYAAEVVDLMELAKAVVKGKVPLHYLKADQVALNKRANLDKHAFNVPGVKLVEKEHLRKAL